MTYQEFLSLSSQQALQGVNPLTASILDVEMTAEALAPVIFQEVAQGYAADPNSWSLLRRTHTIAMVDGAGVLPDEVLTSCAVGAVIASPDDVTVLQNQAFVPNWNDFVSPRDNIQSLLTYWIIRGDDDLHILQAGEEYDPDDGFTGDIEYTGASVPEIPATFSDTLDVPSEVLSDLQNALSKALMGKLGAT